MFWFWFVLCCIVLLGIYNKDCAIHVVGGTCTYLGSLNDQMNW